MSIIQQEYNKIHIPWVLLVVISVFEYIIDYSRFTFLNKHIVFLGLLLICVCNLLLKKKYHISVSFVGVYIIIAFCFFAMVIYNLDFCYTLHWISLIVAIGIPLNVYQADTIRKIFVSFGMIIAVTCVIQLLFPEFFYKFGRLILNSSWEADARRFASWGMYPGLSYQTGTSATIIAVAIAALMGKIAHGQKEKLNKFLMAVILYVGMILTAKRMLLLISIMIPVALYVFSSYVNRKKVSKRIMTLILLFIIAIAFVMIALPYMSNITVVQRFLSSALNGDFTSGRSVLYQQAWELFLENPIIGIGWGNFSKIAGTSVHNVFLQLLAESGLIGLIVFAMISIASFVCTVRALKFSYNENDTIKGVLLTSLLVQIVFLLDCITGNPLYELSLRTVYIFACVVGVGTIKNGFNKNC